MTSAEVRLRGASHAERAGRSPMHLQPKSWESRRAPHVSGRFRAPTDEEIGLLQLLSAQLTIPLGQLARFGGQSMEEMKETMVRLEETGCIVSASVYPDEEPWFWLSHRGARAANLGLQYKIPGFTTWELRRWINEVRLELMKIYPHARWLSDRILLRGIPRRLPVPTAVVDHTGTFSPEQLFHSHNGNDSHGRLNVTAVEVLVSFHNRTAIRRRLERDCALYSTVMYFCSPTALQSLERLRSENSWPNLSLRLLPGFPVVADIPVPSAENGSVDPFALPLLNFLAQHAAAPTDLLAQFMECPLEDTIHVVSALQASGHVNVDRVLQDKFEWVSLTKLGAFRAPTRLKWIRRLAVAHLPLNRVVIESRLYAMQVCPDGRWESRREIEAARRVTGHVSQPHGVVHVNGHRHAIEVRIGIHRPGLLFKTVTKRLEVYDAVVFFCSSNNRRCLEALRRDHEWTDVGILSLPRLSYSILCKK